MTNEELAKELRLLARQTEWTRMASAMTAAANKLDPPKERNVHCYCYCCERAGPSAALDSEPYWTNILEEATKGCISKEKLLKFMYGVSLLNVSALRDAIDRGDFRV